MHLLLSLKLHSSSFQVLPVNLDGSRSVKRQIKDNNSSCTNHSILDKYAKRAIFQNDLPLIMNISFTQFVTLYKFVKNKIVTQEPNVVPRFFPSYSSNPKGLYYPLYCKYQLLKYKPWEDSQNDAWNYETPSDTVYVNAWLNACLYMLQMNLLSVEYIIIDEYSMLVQIAMGWIDRRCRQATCLKDTLFGGKSIILIGDPGQLPPAADKPLYREKPSNPVGDQGYIAYKMFDKVVILDVNQRVRGSEEDQTIFKGILSRLRSGEVTVDDWKLLLTRQPSVASNVDDFVGATRLYYSNEEVTKYN